MISDININNAARQLASRRIDDRRRITCARSGFNSSVLVLSIAIIQQHPAFKATATYRHFAINVVLATPEGSAKRKNGGRRLQTSRFNTPPNSEPSNVDLLADAADEAGEHVAASRILSHEHGHRLRRAVQEYGPLKIWKEGEARRARSFAEKGLA